MKRLWSWLLAVCVILSAFSVLGHPVSAAEKATKKRSIAIVYDNSGSMYLIDDNKPGGKAWCQALYAMEVFASMMNEGDELWVYPMHEITSRGKTYTMDKPLKISNPKDATMIRDIETPKALGTPFEPIAKAFNDLKKADGEKWLIVMTDGTSFDGYDHSGSEKQLAEMINPYVKDVNVIFMGVIGDAVQPKLKEKNDHRAIVDKAKESKDILSKLTAMCNLIFARDELPMSGNTASFDISMKRLIVFVQGDKIANVALSGGAGTHGDEFSPHYSEHKKTFNSGEDLEGAIDDTLQGVITNYYDSPSGSYTLNYDGSMTSIGVYYEPDVEMVVRLVDANGNEVKYTEDLPPGEYKIEYGLVDGQTGEMTDSDLLGKTHYDITYTWNGEKKTITSDDKRGELPLTLGDGDTVELEDITVTYLSGYVIRKSGLDFGWPKGGFNVHFAPAGDFSVEITGGPDDDLYKYSKKGKYKPYVANFYYDGRTLNADEVTTIDFQVTADGSDMQFDVTQDGDHYNIIPQFPDDFEKISQTEVTGTATATYAEPDHEAATASDSFGFQIEIPAKDFAIEVAGGAEDGKYKLSQLEDEPPFVVTFLYGGEQMKAEEVAAVDFKIDVEESNVKFDAELDGDHYNIYPRYPDPSHPENTNDGDVAALATAKYTASGHAAAEAEAEIHINIENDVTGLSATLDKSKERFTLGELNGYTMDLDLRMGGEPLSEEEMNNLDVQVVIADKKGNTIPYTIEKDPVGSKAGITFSKEKVKTGKYTMQVRATTLNELGEETSATDQAKFKVKLLPVWVIMTAIFIVLALLALLLWFILSRKVLPKRVIISDTRYMVDGESNPGDATLNFKGARKKVGTIQITTPKAVAYPGVKGSFTLHVAASDTRFKVLKKALTGKGNLTVQCTGIDASNAVNRVMVSGTAYNWNEDHRLQLRAGEEEAPQFRIANEDTAIMNGEARTGSGMFVNLSMTCTLNFK